MRLVWGRLESTKLNLIPLKIGKLFFLYSRSYCVKLIHSSILGGPPWNSKSIKISTIYN